MKKYFLFSALLLLSGGWAMAQDQTRDRIQDRDKDKDKDQLQQRDRDRIHQEDHLLFKDGKLYQVQKGVMTELKTQFKLRNGGVVNPNGSYQLANQERYQLRNGQCLDQEGNRYLNQNRFNQRKMMTQKELERERNKNMNKAGKEMQKKNPPRGGATRKGKSGG